MKDGMNLYSVASLVREDSPLGKMLQAMREKLRRAGIVFQEPNLGNHITYLSPFYAPIEFAEGFAKGLRFCRLFNSSFATIEAVKCIYLDHDKRACAVLLNPSNIMRDVIEDLRISIRPEWWKYTPDRFTLLMHATAAESPKGAKSFHKKIMRLPGEERPDEVVTSISFSMPTIFLNQKDEGTGNWNPVHF